MKLFLVIVAALIPLGSWATEKPEWQTVPINDGKLTVDMPGKPVITTKSDSSIVGDVISTLTTVKVPGSYSVTVDCSAIPGPAVFFAGSDTIYSNAKGSFLSKVHGKADSWEPVTKDGNNGQKLTFRTPPNDKDHPGWHGEAQFFLVDDTLYVISVIEFVTGDPVSEERVFGSLSFQGS